MLLRGLVKSEQARRVDTKTTGSVANEQPVPPNNNPTPQSVKCFEDWQHLPDGEGRVLDTKDGSGPTVKWVHHALAPYRRVAVARKSKQSRTSRKLRGQRASLPPSIPVSPVVRHTLRFYIGGAVSNRTITILDVFGALGGICTITNSVLTLVATSFRIHGVTLYPASGGLGEIAWADTSSGAGPDQAHEAILPAGIAQTETVRSSPPAKSLASFWINVSAISANPLFRVTTSNSGHVLDLDVEYTFRNELSPVTVIIATGVLGVYYYLRLDQSSGAPRYFDPVDRPNTQ